MGKKYQIGIGKKSYLWESNIVSDKAGVPLRLDLEENHVLKTRQKVFSLQSLDEHIYPPHKIGDVIIFTEKQALDIIEKLQQVARTDFEKLAERKLKSIQRIGAEKEAKKNE